MKQFFALAILTLLAIGVTACGAAVPPTPKPAPTLTAIKVSSTVVAEGKVTPVKGAALSFQAVGTVAEVLVNVGDRVEAGAVIARLETKSLEL